MLRQAFIVVVVAALPVCGQDPKPPSLTPEEQKQAAEAERLTTAGVQLFRQGKPVDAIEKMKQALELLEKLYPPSKAPAGQVAIAESLNNLGVLHRSIGDYDRALQFYQRALGINNRLYPSDRFPDGHPILAANHGNLGVLLEVMGSLREALIHHQKALAMYERAFPMDRFKDGHPNLAIGFSNIGYLYVAMGEFDRGLPYLERSLSMRERLFPPDRFKDGHPDLARSHDSLATCFEARGDYDKAVRHYEKALAMRAHLYPTDRFPDGHPDLAQSLNNLGLFLQFMQQYEKAVPYLDKALAMNQRLFPPTRFPNGHPETIRVLNNLGLTLQNMGDYAKAIDYLEQAAALYSRIYPPDRYPDGHPDYASLLGNLSVLEIRMGKDAQALRHLQAAETMRGRLNRRAISTFSEAEALSFVSAQPHTRDGLLTLAMRLPEAAPTAYDSVWNRKAAVTRVLAQRHAAARAAGTSLAHDLDRLKGLRRHVDRLLQNRSLAPSERDKLLATATDDRDSLERTLAQTLPMLQRSKEMEGLGPAALADMLPPGSIVIDLVEYTRIEFDRMKVRKPGDLGPRCYAAFILAKGRPIRLVDLGPATPINQAVAEWRTAIEKRGEGVAGLRLRDLIWAKFAPQIPAGTMTLFLSPDGDLARLPWASLPVSEKRVSLEDYAVATIPHGPFLLESLKYPLGRGSEAALLLGGIAYNSKTWTALPGTMAELATLAALAPTPPTRLTGAGATPQRLTEFLPKARYAHLATHGYFDGNSLTAEKQLARQALESRPFGEDRRRVAAKNPLAYTGLVLANGEIMSGLSLVDLPLENLKLVTLSACETGLGEYTGGEGVQGLQRAFHLAGCPNVGASLWKVNDAATAALMAKFYHEMWVNKKPPIEALREAQLTIYRNPGLIPDLAGERGPVRVKEAVTAPTAVEPATRRERADTKLWAAFVLSGLGR